MEKNLEFYKELLLNESKKHGIYSPLTAAPKNNFDEIFTNCFLGDGYIQNLNRIFIKIIIDFIILSNIAKVCLFLI